MYTLMANVFALRHEMQDNEIGPVEIVEIFSTADTPSLHGYGEDDVLCIFDPNEDVPEQPGVYSVMMVVKVRFVQDYWGDIDIDPEIVWHNDPFPLKPEEAVAMLEDAGMYDPNKPEDVEWAKRVLKFGGVDADKKDVLTFLTKLV